MPNSSRLGVAPRTARKLIQVLGIIAGLGHLERNTVAMVAAFQCFRHLVDFDNHSSTGNPFDVLSEQQLVGYIARRRKAINFLRAPAFENLSARHGIAVNMIASRIMCEGGAGGINPWSPEHYDDTILLTKLALVTGLPA